MGDAAEKLDEHLDPLIEAFKTHEHFSKVLLDAFVLLTPAGKIIKANQMFAQLVGLKTKQILKSESLSEMLKFAIREKDLPLNEVLQTQIPTRIDEVRGTTATRNDLNLILGIYPFLDANHGALGCFVMIRDVTAETNLQDKYKSTAIKSITDPLTGMFTRGYFEEYLATMYNALKSGTLEDTRISVAMLDIDFFKKVNDVYGHQAGDHVIQITAETMRGMFRKTDVICRYGGEEFLVIMPGTDLKGAAVAAEKTRKAIEDRKVEFDGKPIPITISIGVAQFNHLTETPEQTIAHADAALYESKHAGRNQVSIHGADGIKTVSGSPKKV